MEFPTFTVTEINHYISNRFSEDAVLNGLFVTGELSNYKIYPSGHHYFTLKDSNCSLRCVMFRNSAVRVRFRPENGMRVSVFGSISVYDRDGAYQLYAKSIIPEGVGDLQLAFEQLKKQLSQEGLFSSERKKPLPRFPKKIALVTSPAGAAVRDMIRILRNRWPLTDIIVIPVSVQGDPAPGEISRAIRLVNEQKLADLILTGRGGGSLEDLWAFNTEEVARAIFESEIPIVSAVGHEPDVVISDYVADVRASTPSNAAEIAVPSREECLKQVHNNYLRCAKQVETRIKREELKFDQLTRLLYKSPERLFLDQRLKLKLLLQQLEHAEFGFLNREDVRLGALCVKLDELSPLKILSRGYCVTQSESGSVINSVRQINKNDKIRLIYKDGTADCTVLEKYTNGEEERVI